MLKRGQKSSAELATIGPAGIVTMRRPEPTPDMTQEQGEVWQSVVNRLPAEWFPAETLPMLAQYCRHVVSSRHVAQLIERAMSDGEFDLDEYNRLLIMQEREGRAMSSLASRMRLTQQSSLHFEKAQRKKRVVPEAAKLWEG